MFYVCECGVSHRHLPVTCLACTILGRAWRMDNIPRKSTGWRGRDSQIANRRPLGLRQCRFREDNCYYLARDDTTGGWDNMIQAYEESR